MVNKKWVGRVFLYDCLQSVDNSLPMQHKSPEYDSNALYRAYRTCIVGKDFYSSYIMGDRKTATLRTLVNAEMDEELPPLSLHMKLDVEGCEWVVLEEILQDSNMLKALRTLTVEFHMRMGCGDKKETLEENVVKEKVEFLETFRNNGQLLVAGSTVENFHASFVDLLERREEPEVHVATGMSLSLTTVTYVNRALLLT